MPKCVECGEETFYEARTGIYTKSFLCTKCQEKHYEVKTIKHVVEVEVLVRKED